MKRKTILSNVIALVLSMFLASIVLADCPPGKAEVTITNPAGKVHKICVSEKALPGLEQASEASGVVTTQPESECFVGRYDQMRYSGKDPVCPFYTTTFSFLELVEPECDLISSAWVETPDDMFDLTCGSAGAGNTYYTEIGGAPPEGLYYFGFEHVDGNTYTCEEQYTPGQLAYPILTNIANGDVIDTLTPLLDWQDVIGAIEYKVRIWNADRSVKIYDSRDDVGYFSESEYYIPSGVLSEYQTYIVEILAYDEGHHHVGYLRIYIVTFGDGGEKPTVVSTDPADGATGVSTDLEWISVTFDKPMASRHSVSSFGSWPLTGGTPNYWSGDQRTYNISRDDAGTPLPGATTIEVVLNDPAHPCGFQDTEANILDTYSFNFTTAGVATTDNSIWGHITLSGQTDYSGVTVTLVENQSFTTTTDADGYYYLEGFPNGTYTVSASKTGYTTGTSSGWTFTGGGTHHEYADLTLSPI